MLHQWLCVLAVTTATVASPEKKPLTAATGEPEFLARDDAAWFFAPWTEKEYHKELDGHAGKVSSLVLFTRKPPGLGPQARFGIDLPIRNDDLMLSFALDGDADRGYVLYEDVNGNGDLGDDAPLRFEKKNGRHVLLVKSTARDAKTGETYPSLAKVSVTHEKPGDTQPRLYVRVDTEVLRRGTMRIGDRDVAFGLTGSLGKYDTAVLDLNGDGPLDLGRWSSETFLTDKHVRLGKIDYELVIDPLGRRLTLTPLAKPVPPSTLLRPGFPAPDFSFVDQTGKPRRLSQYRGKVVLLDFWGNHCSPCLKDLPALLDAYAKLHHAGFEIIGIDGVDSPATLRKIIAEEKMPWPQAVGEENDGPLHKLYRFRSWPTYVLIAPDGNIIAKRTGGGISVADLERLSGLTRK